MHVKARSLSNRARSDELESPKDDGRLPGGMPGSRRDAGEYPGVHVQSVCAAGACPRDALDHPDEYLKAPARRQGARAGSAQRLDHPGFARAHAELRRPELPRVATGQRLVLPVRTVQRVHGDLPPRAKRDVSHPARWLARARAAGLAPTQWHGPSTDYRDPRDSRSGNLQRGPQADDGVRRWPQRGVVNGDGERIGCRRDREHHSRSPGLHHARERQGRYQRWRGARRIRLIGAGRGGGGDVGAVAG